MGSNVVIASTGLKNSATGSLDLQEGEETSQKVSFAGRPEAVVRLCFVEDRVSRWSQSSLKRLFDIGCALLAFLFLLPVFLILGLAVRLTSRGPVLFKQRRTGMNRSNFTILKFRTMEHLESGAHKRVTTASNQRFTSIGPFLRRWKLDELPQLFNVLAGHMSLIGPRPKLPEHQVGVLRCRPGITGAATLLFAREEHVLACVQVESMDVFYHSVILPAKYQLDREYMARATFLSDLRVIINTALRHWDSSAIYDLLQIEPLKMKVKAPKLKPRAFKLSPTHLSSSSGDESLVSAGRLD